MRDLVDEYESTGEPNLSTIAGCANARYTAKVYGSKIDMTAPELPIELNKMIVWIMHNEQGQRCRKASAAPDCCTSTDATESKK